MPFQCSVSGIPLSPPTAQQSEADVHVTPRSELEPDGLGEFSIAQTTADVGASGILAAAARAKPLNELGRLSIRDESPGELTTEPVISFGGFAAKLISASPVPAKQRVKAAKARGLKKPDLELRFFFIGFFVWTRLR